MMANQRRPKPPVVVTLDWRAYRDKFRQLHGDPVLVGGRLLFSDGWAMDATTRGAPTEWRPPDDAEELRLLQAAYWLERLAVVKAERDLLQRMVTDLRDVQAGRGAPLQQTWIDSEDGVKVRVTGDVNPEEHEAGRLLDCEAEVERCVKMVEALKDAARVSIAG